MNKEEYADKLFVETLNECLNIRKERKLIYGNSWLHEDGVNSNFYGGIINKINRLKILHNNRFINNSKEKYEDCLRDLVILTLFTLANFRDEQNKLKSQKRIEEYAE